MWQEVQEEEGEEQVVSEPAGPGSSSCSFAYSAAAASAEPLGTWRATLDTNMRLQV